jgi:hypothetical protein
VQGLRPRSGTALARRWRVVGENDLRTGSKSAEVGHKVGSFSGGNQQAGQRDGRVEQTAVRSDLEEL